MMPRAFFIGLIGLAALEFAPASAQSVPTVQELMTPPARPRTAPGAGDVAPAALTGVGVQNLVALARLYGAVAYFHPTEAAINTDWDAWLLGAVVAAEQASSSGELQRRFDLMLGGVAPTVRIVPTTAADSVGPPARPAGVKEALRWRYLAYSDARDTGQRRSRTVQEDISRSDLTRIDLGNGQTAVVPLAAWRSGPIFPDFSAMESYRKPRDFKPSGFDRSTRLAAVIKAWAVLRNFSPYYSIAGRDWDSQLAPSLRSAATDTNDLQFADTLRRMIAHLSDGHGRVIYAKVNTGSLPIQWDSIESRLVITHAAPGAAAVGIKAGDVVETIGGAPTADALDAQRQLASGSRQATDFVARRNLLSGPSGQTARISIRQPTGIRTVDLKYGTEPSPSPDSSRPPVLTELEPGIVYFDATRATEEQLTKAHQVLTKAKGVILDLRGYPQIDPAFLDHMVDHDVQGAKFDLPVFTRPGGNPETYEAGGWTVSPAEPRWTDNIVVLVDVPAISYAESLLGVIKGNHLATLVGEPSGGANGNIGIISLPGGYRAVFTSMRVENRDGSQHHIIGVTPDVPVSQTIDATRAGRDLMIERAQQIVRDRARNH